MGIDVKTPRRLYKYRDFSNRTLDMIVSDNVYFADPSTFNDPLDTRPSLEVDLDEGQLEDVVRKFVERRTLAEMSTAARSIRYRGPKTMDHIERQSRRQAERLIKDIQYCVSNSEYDSAEYKRFLLCRYIEEELLRQYDRGIVSFAERATCPLMWSHYGDQHRGICIGYSTPATLEDLYKVRYGGSRLVGAGNVAAMLKGNVVARRQVDEAVLLRKAASWRYEREWRLIGPRGCQNSPLEMEEIVFGMRCRSSAKYTVMRALKGRDRPLKFYEVREVPGTFRLKKYTLSYDDELFIHFPRRSLSMLEQFEDRSATVPSKSNVD